MLTLGEKSRRELITEQESWKAKKMTLGRTKPYNNLGYMGTTTPDKPILNKLDAVQFLIF